MDCQDVRSLLAFTHRAVEDVDATERQATGRHLETCPDCAAFAQANQGFDQAVGAALRDVPVPPAFKSQLLGRLRQRRPRPLPWIAAAAAVLIALGLSGYWYSSRPLALDGSSLDGVASRAGTSHQDVESWFREAGLNIKTPSQFNYHQLLTYDVVEFEGRRVAKLVFFHPSERAGRPAVAQILVLPKEQFTADRLPRADNWVPFFVNTIPDDDMNHLVLSTSATLDPFLVDAQ